MEGLSGFDIEALLEAYRASESFPALQKCLKALPREGLGAAAGKFRRRRVAFTANFSTQFICGATRLALATKGIWAEVFEDEFNNWELSLLNKVSALYRFKPDTIVILLSSIQLAFAERESPENLADKISHLAAEGARLSGAKIILTLPEALAEERGVNDWAYQWRQKLVFRLQQMLPPECLTISLDPLIREVGARNWYSHRYYVSSKLPFHPNHTKAVAELLAGAIQDAITPRLKLVITDLDNTLWGGIVGEAGATGVDLNHSDLGYGHLRLQKLLQHLNQGGVLLAIASKNNSADALEVFRTRKEMILKEANFSAMRINWEPKSGNIREILEELKLSTAGVVFLDDSPFEREEVRRALPGIIVPELGSDAANWADELLQRGTLQNHGVSSAADRARVELYQIEKNREAEKVKFKSEKEFLSSLELALTAKPYAGNEQRVIELLSKTNQFNLTTRRHSRAQLENLLQQGGRYYVFELDDKFGSHGIIGVLIAVPAAGNKFKIDTFLMSCRVIGRGVERAILSYVISDLKKTGCDGLLGEFIPTEKNQMAAGLYPQLGFRLLASGPDLAAYELGMDAIDPAKLEHFCAIRFTGPGKT